VLAFPLAEGLKDARPSAETCPGARLTDDRALAGLQSGSRAQRVIRRVTAPGAVKAPTALAEAPASAYD